MISIPFLHLRKVEAPTSNDVGAAKVRLRLIIERCENESHISTMELMISMLFLHLREVEGRRNVGAAKVRLRLIIERCENE